MRGNNGTWLVELYDDKEGCWYPAIFGLSQQIALFATREVARNIAKRHREWSKIKTRVVKVDLGPHIGFEL